jgi:hypothetical protein
MENKETCLGDGLYASFDEQHICLRWQLDRDENRIYLSGSAYANLTKFITSLEI